MKKSKDQNVEISVKCVYVPEESRPHERFYFFAYTVTIKNSGKENVKLISRHWVITDGFGRVEEVRGEGVIGKQPHLRPGQSFEYTSFCPLATTTGSMQGTYQMKTDEGEEFDVEIPQFFLIEPTQVN